MHPRIDIRRRHAQRVLCDVDLNKRPLIPRKYETLASAIGGAVLWGLMVVALAFLGGWQ